MGRRHPLCISPRALSARLWGAIRPGVLGAPAAHRHALAHAYRKLGTARHVDAQAAIAGTRGVGRHETGRVLLAQFIAYRLAVLAQHRAFADLAYHEGAGTALVGKLG